MSRGIKLFPFSLFTFVYFLTSVTLPNPGVQGFILGWVYFWHFCVSRMVDQTSAFFFFISCCTSLHLLAFSRSPIQRRMWIAISLLNLTIFCLPSCTFHLTCPKISSMLNIRPVKTNQLSHLQDIKSFDTFLTLVYRWHLQML